MLTRTTPKLLAELIGTFAFVFMGAGGAAGWAMAPTCPASPRSPSLTA